MQFTCTVVYLNKTVVHLCCGVPNLWCTYILMYLNYGVHILWCTLTILYVLCGGPALWCTNIVVYLNSGVPNCDKGYTYILMYIND